MKKRHILVNILTGIPAFVLTIVLIACLLVTSLYAVTLNTITPNTISKMTQTVVVEMVKAPDFEQMILENEVVKQNIEELDISTEIVGELIQSDAAADVIDLLAADVSGLLTGELETLHLTPDALIGIVDEHSGNLAEIINQLSEEPVAEENMAELEQMIVDTVAQNAEELTSVIPDVETIRTTVVQDTGVEEYLQYLNRDYLTYAILVCVGLALIIYALRYYRFGGFLWLGVGCTLAGGVLVSLKSAFYDYLLPLTMSGDAQDMPGMVQTLIDSVLGSVSVAGWILLGAAVLFVIAFTLLYILVVKKRACVDTTV